jgi:hypothetical protein
MDETGEGGTTVRKNVIKTTVAVLAGLLMLLGLSGTAEAKRQLLTLTMEELPLQPVDNLTAPGGVRFDFKINGVDSNDATYGGSGPGRTTFVQDPSLEGSSEGVLTVSFSQPTNVVRFGVAVLFGGPVTVQIYNPGGRLRETIRLQTQVLTSFPEARFAYQGGAVGKIAVSFDAPGGGRFALDNLTFRAPAKT